MATSGATLQFTVSATVKIHLTARTSSVVLSSTDVLQRQCDGSQAARENANPDAPLKGAYEARRADLVLFVPLRVERRLSRSTFTFRVW